LQALNEALDELATMDPQQSRVVELRFLVDFRSRKLLKCWV
jgi:hypothetical protein